jgi:hypothetical protein
MPNLPDNLATWTNYEWPRGGDEWSDAWGGSDTLWWGSLFPRIRAFVPTASVLEIAPGFGRCTVYLKDLCQHLTIVDITERCIAACRQRFSASDHIDYYVNDGSSLAMVPDGSIDFVFSYDSLVHVEADLMQNYMHEVARKLKPWGAGFFHHSNLAAFQDEQTGEFPFENIHWRASTMSAKLFEQFCDAAGLQCIGQEIVNWGGAETIDSFSLFTRKDSPFARPNVVIENPYFMDEAARLKTLAQLYEPVHFPLVNRLARRASLPYVQPGVGGYTLGRLSGAVTSKLHGLKSRLR